MRFGPPPRMTILSRPLGRASHARDAGERRLVGRVHVGGRRSEFGRAGVDALVDRRDAERRARLGDVALVEPGERGQARVGEAVRLQQSQILGVLRQAEVAHLVFEADDLRHPLEEPRVDARHLVDLGDAHAQAHRLRDLQQPIGRRRADRRAQGVVVVALAETFDLD